MINRILFNIEGAGLTAPALCDVDEAKEEDENKNKKQAATPLCAEWLSILVAEEIRQRPNIMSNKAMRGFLSAYAMPPCSASDYVLQNTCTRAKLEFFGKPFYNVQCAHYLKTAMSIRGHPTSI